MNGLLFVVRLGVLLLAELAVLLDEAAAVPELEASDVAAVLVVAACPVVEFSTGGAFLQGAGNLFFRTSPATCPSSWSPWSWSRTSPPEGGCQLSGCL